MEPQKNIPKKNSISAYKVFIAVSVFVNVCFSIQPLLAASCELGAYVGNADHRAPYASEIQSFENLAGRHIGANLVYWAFNDGDFPTQQLNDGLRYHDGYNTHTTLQLAWEPWSRLGADDTTFALTDIIAGTHDNYITKFAQDCRNWQDPIHLRFMHEMVSAGPERWYPWQDNSTQYVQAWNHVRQIFRDQNATNVEFVWAPNNFPPGLQVLAPYYPGVDNVDWLGMDGFNSGEDGQAGWPSWQNFDDLFYNLYHVMVDHPEVFGDKKIMVAEFASSEIDVRNNKKKSDWIFDTFLAIKQRYPEIAAFYWFNTAKETDWRINSSPESLLAFQTAMQDPYFTSHVVPEPSALVLFGMGLMFIMGRKNNKKHFNI